MKTLTQRIINACRGNRAGLLLFAALAAATLVFLAQPSGGAAIAALTPLPVLSGTGEVQVAVKPSQTKFVQGGNNILYLDVAIKTPHSGQAARQRDTDMLIVLDRSGSMAGAEKMPYAKAAIQDVLARLNERDRFALVSFADDAAIDAPLAAVTASQRERLAALVNGIQPGGGTNIGGGLGAALDLLSADGGDRARKVLLLSDGQANQGVIQPEALAQLAAQLAARGAVLSTIGMGLDFNETLMTQLADQGMGHYAFLESLAGLGQILNDDLNATRAIFASGSTLELALGDGVELLDAGGYPVDSSKAGTARIASGQLLAGADKHFVITLSVPTQNTGALALGKMQLSYQQQGRELIVPVDADLQLAVVAAEQRQQAVASIDKEVYQHSWIKNNFGVMQKKLGQWLREGKKDQAEKALHEYRQAMQAAEADSNVPLASPSVNGKLDDMKTKLEEAFAGSRDERAQKQKRAAKTLQYDAIKQQRGN